jgi:HK97 family phage portal protein
VSFLFNRSAQLSATQLLAERTGNRNGRNVKVSREQARRISTVWACLRLRADLESTMPLDVFRRVDGVQVEQQKPPVLVTPGGSEVSIIEHLYSSRVDLDSVGNAVGIIHARDGGGRPAVIQLADTDTVQLRQAKTGERTWKIAGKTYAPDQVWHEKQYTVSGSPLGLSPIAHAAATMHNALSAMEFAGEWFGNNATPGQHLRNKAKKLNPKESDIVAERYRSKVRSGDVFVTGSDWELSLLSAKASEASFLEQLGATNLDVCRYLGVPGDMVDVSPDGSSVTYANITQRNLQFLIMSLGPALTRREEHYSRLLLPAPRYMKFNTGALLRMDLKSRYDAYKIGIDGKWLTPSRIQERENEPPFTPAELAEMDRLFPPPLAKSKEQQIAELLQKSYLAAGAIVSEDEIRHLLEQAGMELDGTFTQPNGGTTP